MRMERIAVTMPHSTVTALRRYANLHDVDQYIVVKEAVAEMCRMHPPSMDLMEDHVGMTERVFISLPDVVMRLLEFWTKDTGIPKQKLVEWSIRKFTENKEEESNENNESRP